MSPGDPVIWIDRGAAGAERPGHYVATYGGRLVIETVTHTGHLGLRYVDPRDVRPVTSTGNPNG
jgi:hypothetical protein